MHLARAGAAGFFITGKNSGCTHDLADDVLESLQKPNIMTIWSDDITSDVAWDFLHLPLVVPSPTLRVVVVSDPNGCDVGLMASILTELEQAVIR